VGLQELERLLEALPQLDLQLDGIGLEIDEPAAGGQFGQRLGPAVQVDQQRGLAVQAFELGLAHAEAAAVLVQRAKRPPLAQPEPPHYGGDELCAQRRAVVIGMGHQHGGRAGVGLHVVGLAAQPLEPEQVVEVLPHHPGDGHLGHHSEQDHLRRGDRRGGGGAHAPSRSTWLQVSPSATWPLPFSSAAAGRPLGGDAATAAVSGGATRAGPRVERLRSRVWAS
jgi:hypothetical protein